MINFENRYFPNFFSKSELSTFFLSDELLDLNWLYIINVMISLLLICHVIFWKIFGNSNIARNTAGN